MATKNAAKRSLIVDYLMNKRNCAKKYEVSRF